ncbi:MAG TPA: CcoQ/FixQ family Cbb3-type cytochrome c oxidase assembly chaperone [Gemmatimonadales bacterium]|nr:CcoQ/FixQ family Cbb3-type cytochrome c oxidase assembly chaperone [Gemmatimonadales bacterium]
MNPIVQDTAAAVTTGWITGIATATFIVFFAGWIWWAWHPKHRAELDEAARLPLENGGDQ